MISLFSVIPNMALGWALGLFLIPFLYWPAAVNRFVPLPLCMRVFFSQQDRFLKIKAGLKGRCIFSFEILPNGALRRLWQFSLLLAVCELLSCALVLSLALLGDVLKHNYMDPVSTLAMGFLLSTVWATSLSTCREVPLEAARE